MDSAHILLNGATVTGAGYSVNSSLYPGGKSFQATVTGIGVVAATVLIEISNDGSNWLTLGTITLSGTTSDSDGFDGSGRWVYHRANLTAISGTGATVTVLMGA